MNLKSLPKADRPREKLIQKGPQNLKDEELLAILLGTGVEGKNVLEVAKQILRKYSKKRLLKMQYNDLSKIKGVGPAKACTILAAQELIKRALEIGEETLPIIRSTKDVIAQFTYLRDKSREHLAGLYLNARNEMVHKKHLFVGTLNANLVHPREIFEYALLGNAASVILVHNHPSGDPEPSEDDLAITKRIIEAGKIMGIDVLDHIIITKTKIFSFKEKKLI
ncbi:DNA repair protein RadC [Patescibacteria group bacterium]|nr:DNA repair protein RadC [Patescibacteria group bacterium]MBU4368035.1 DNA repair protein RadC [Patescibacteria group bacterium]MBU4462206.1 DNA repair protein RadC [Patescibacteria group bacterium]MCG2699562.1 DNA repair protein RadC [Candidatus Parcubacteria bacterium]